MISRKGKDFDIIIVSAEYYDDHPFSGIGIIAKVLEAKGFSVGIIEKPQTEKDFKQLGTPKLCFCITSGSIDSMVNNYTPMKRERIERKNNTDVPDRAVIFYCNKIRQYFKGSKMVIGGIEASLRRFVHYDYWANNLRRSILFDSRADVLVYGNGEKQIIEIAERLRDGKDLKGIRGTCIISKEVPTSFKMLPSCKEVFDSKKKFCQMSKEFSNYKYLAQEYENNYLLQYKYPDYTPEYLDWIYSLDYSRNIHPKSFLKMAKFSVVTHRGCIGRCNFCSIGLHQGDKIISRSEKSILDEIKKLTKHPKFKGFIDDLGGPSANMYGMDCVKKCKDHCLSCVELNKSHGRIIGLLRKARKIEGIKKIFIRSGIRYDLAVKSKEYVNEIVKHHISGCLKVAPEHFSKEILKLMNKSNDSFDDFIVMFDKINRGEEQLKFYFMVGHPGDDMEEVYMLKDIIKSKGLRNIESFQFFTPLPMTLSSCMYWTGLNPFNLKKIKVIYDYNTKKKMKRIILNLLKPKRRW
ncbi:MAG: YgiQ family radical SAM protein [Nanoarchaeota archaeon]|nr:YgiQ family radical SAM protein [Nanoarchaeota archaeon]